MEKANSQAAMHTCANEERMRVEVELNDIYQRLLLAARREPGAVEAIMASEKAWIGYRDAYLNAMYPAKDKQAAYGSIFPMEFDLLRAKLSQQHIDALRELLKRYGNSN